MPGWDGGTACAKGLGLPEEPRSEPQEVQGVGPGEGEPSAARPARLWEAAWEARLRACTPAGLPAPSGSRRNPTQSAGGRRARVVGEGLPSPPAPAAARPDGARVLTPPPRPASPSCARLGCASRPQPSARHGPAGPRGQRPPPGDLGHRDPRTDHGRSELGPQPHTAICFCPGSGDRTRGLS